MACTREKSEIAQDLLRYLIGHPQAQDTLEGIAEWWIPERRIESRTAKIREVLKELAAAGLILERQGPDSRARYLINSDKQAEILALLSGPLGKQ